MVQLEVINAGDEVKSQAKASAPIAVSTDQDPKDLEATGPVANGKLLGQPPGHRDRWVFMDKSRHATLRKFAWTKIVRHWLAPKNDSPDDPDL